MEADEIIFNLKSTTFKFAYAGKVKKELASLDRTDLRLLKRELKRHLRKPENVNLNRSLNFIIAALTELIFDFDYENASSPFDDDEYQF